MKAESKSFIISNGKKSLAKSENVYFNAFEDPHVIVFPFCSTTHEKPTINMTFLTPSESNVNIYYNFNVIIDNLSDFFFIYIIFHFFLFPSHKNGHYFPFEAIKKAKNEDDAGDKYVNDVIV